MDGVCFLFATFVPLADMLRILLPHVDGFVHKQRSYGCRRTAFPAAYAHDTAQAIVLAIRVRSCVGWAPRRHFLYGDVQQCLLELLFG